MGGWQKKLFSFERGMSGLVRQEELSAEIFELLY